MSGEHVPRQIKTQARALLALARRRHIHLDWLPDESQLDDLAIANRLIQDFRPPSDEHFHRAMALASLHKVELPEKAASNKFVCYKFIREHPLEDNDREPSDKQKYTLTSLEEYLEAKAPRECWISENAWEKFVKQSINRDEFDKAYEIVVELQIPLGNYDPGSLGWQVYVLKRAKDALADPKGAQRQRVEEMLIAGEDPYVIASSMRIADADVLKISDELEATGHELAWA